MPLVLPYLTMSSSFTPSGTNIDEYVSSTMHSDVIHNNSHSKLLQNDNDIADYLNLKESFWTTSLNQQTEGGGTWSRGFQKFPNNIMFQWIDMETMAAEYNQQKSWLMPFVQVFSATVSPISLVSSVVTDEWFQIVSFDLTTITVRYQWFGQGSKNNMRPHVFAIGTWSAI